MLVLPSRTSCSRNSGSFDLEQPIFSLGDALSYDIITHRLSLLGHPCAYFYGFGDSVPALDKFLGTLSLKNRPLPLYILLSHHGTSFDSPSSQISTMCWHSAAGTTLLSLLPFS